MKYKTITKQKGPLPFFSALCDFSCFLGFVTFLGNFLLSSKDPHHLLLIFCNRMDGKKIPKGLSESRNMSRLTTSCVFSSLLIGAFRSESVRFGGGKWSARALTIVVKSLI